jgi:hypothetical protein
MPAQLPSPGGGRARSSEATPQAHQPPADRNARLHTLKLILEIIAMTLTVVGGILALVWRSR